MRLLTGHAFLLCHHTHRSKDDALRSSVVLNITASIEAACVSRGVSCSVKRVHDAAAVLCNDDVVKVCEFLCVITIALYIPFLLHTNPYTFQRFVKSIEASKDTLDSILRSDGACSTLEADEGRKRAGDDTGQISSLEGGESIESNVMVSGAGHDAMAIAEVAHMGMLFVRCRGGVSHSPLEHVEPEDVAAASAALYHYLVDRC